MTEDDELNLPIAGIDTAPEISVDGYQGVMIRNGVAKINFYSVRYDPLSRQKWRRVTLVLNLGISTLISVQDSLSKLVRQLEIDGVIEVAEPAETLREPAQIKIH